MPPSPTPPGSSDQHGAVLELTPGGEWLLLRAGFGCLPETVDNLRVRVTDRTQPGVTLRTGAGGHRQRLGHRAHCERCPVLNPPSARSGLTVAIDGGDGPWGVLGVQSAVAREFVTSDRDFVQALANVLADAIGGSDRGRHPAPGAARRADRACRTGCSSMTAWSTPSRGAHARAERDPVPRPRPVQARQRQPRPSAGDRCSSTSAPRLRRRAPGRHRGALRRRRVRDPARGHRRRAGGDRVAERIAGGLAQSVRARRRRACHREHRDRGGRRRPRRPRNCFATPTRRCTGPRSAAGAASSCSTTAMRGGRSTGSGSRTNCAVRSSATSSTRLPAGGLAADRAVAASRPCFAGTIHERGLVPPATSSRWPRRRPDRSDRATGSRARLPPGRPLARELARRPAIA